MRTNASPPERPAPRQCLDRPRENSLVLAISFHADDGRLYALSAAQFLSLTLEPASPGESSEPVSGSERLNLVFSSGRVEVLGTGLSDVSNALAAGELAALQAVPVQYHTALTRGP